jgi:hypothetical protein
MIAGRRSGKSLGIAVLAAYLAACCDYRGVLAKGERGILPIMAGSTQQAGQILNFLKGIFTGIPRFAAIVKVGVFPHSKRAFISADRIQLRNRVDIEVRPASFRTIRGITAIAAIAEEISTWQSDESLNPDFEILAAVRPALATTAGPLFCIGSPRAKRGVTWETYRKHFGPNGHPAILVANCATKTFNPTLKQSVIDRAYEDDPSVAAAEWGGKFRDDLESYVSPETVEGAIEFAKLVSTRQIESPLTKAEWVELIQFQADSNIKDPKLSKQQKFSKYIDTEVGRELYWASKAAPGREVEQADADSYIADVRHPGLRKAAYAGEGIGDVGLGRYRGNRSTPMRDVSESSDDAYLSAASALESGRARRTAEEMRLDIVPRGGNAGADDEGEVEGGAHREAQARAARRHAARPERSFENHYSDALSEDPSLAARVFADERARSQKRLRAGA